MRKIIFCAIAALISIVTEAQQAGNFSVLRITSTPTNDNALTDILAWNPSTKLVETRAASSFSGTPAGSNTQIQYNNSGAFGASANLTYDPSTNTVKAAASGISQSGAGTANNNIFIGPDFVDTHTGTIRWSLWIGEEHKIINNATGRRIHDSYNVGGDINTIQLDGPGGDIFSHGNWGGTQNKSYLINSTIIGGGSVNAFQDTLLLTNTASVGGGGIGSYKSRRSGNGQCYTFGMRAYATGPSSLAGGYIVGYDGFQTFSSTTRPVEASGIHAFNWSANSTSQGGGRGVTGDYAVALGGRNVKVSGKGSATIGGYGLTETDSATVRVQRIAFTGEAGGIGTVTTTTTLDKWTYSTVLVDATGGAVTINLPAAASNSGVKFTVKKIDSSGNAVTIDGNASETIDGATTKTRSSQWDFYTIHCDGSAWYIIAQ